MPLLAQLAAPPGSSRRAPDSGDSKFFAYTERFACISVHASEALCASEEAGPFLEETWTTEDAKLVGSARGRVAVIYFSVFRRVLCTLPKGWRCALQIDSGVFGMVAKSAVDKTTRTTSRMQLVVSTKGFQELVTHCTIPDGVGFHQPPSFVAQAKARYIDRAHP